MILSMRATEGAHIHGDSGLWILARQETWVREEKVHALWIFFRERKNKRTETERCFFDFWGYIETVRRYRYTCIERKIYCRSKFQKTTSRLQKKSTHLPPPLFFGGSEIENISQSIWSDHLYLQWPLQWLKFWIYPQWIYIINIIYGPSWISSKIYIYIYTHYKSRHIPP